MIEDVVDSLDGIDQACPDQFHGRIGLVVVDGNANRAHFAGFLEILKGAAPVVTCDPFGIPHVQLLHVDRLHAEVAEARLGGLDDVVVGENLLDADPWPRGPELVLRRDLGGDVDPLLRVSKNGADKAFAVAFAIG